jgi:hypothetical protein
MRWLRPTRNLLALALACALLCACDIGYDADLGTPPQPADDLAVCLAHLHHTSHVESVTDGTVTHAIGAHPDKRGPRAGFALRVASLCKISVLVETAMDFAGTLKAHPHALITVKGEYEYTPQGGIIRWTSTDPAYHHVGGWINIANYTYK